MNKINNDDNKEAVSRSRSMICSADEQQENAERFTPEQRADTVIKKWQTEKTFLIHAHYTADIAAEIQEAVELERAYCASMAEHYGNELKRFMFPNQDFYDSIATAIRARNS